MVKLICAKNHLENSMFSFRFLLSKSFRLLFLLGVLILISSGCGKMLFNKRPRYSSIDSTYKGNYVVFNDPYFQKRLNGFGHGMRLALATGAGYGLYSNIDRPDQTQKLAISSGSFAVSYGLITAYYALLGNKHCDKRKFDANKWVDAYNKKYQTTLVYVPDSNLQSAKTLFTIDFTKRKEFKPKNVEDVKYFAKTFPQDDHLSALIQYCTTVFTKEQLLQVIELFNSDVQLVAPAMVEYARKSISAEEMQAAFNQFPIAEASLEKEYMEKISTYPLVKDFFVRFPQSQFGDALVNRMISRLKPSQMDTIRLISDKSVSSSMNMRLQNEIILSSNSLASLEFNLNRFPAAQVPIEIANLSVKSNYDNAKKLYAFFTSKPEIKRNSTKILSEIRRVYVSSMRDSVYELEYSKKKFTEQIANETWLTEDSSIANLCDSIVIDYLNSVSEESYFTGDYTNGKPNGPGKLYRGSFGDVLEGEFLNGYLTGIGRSRSIRNEYSYGHFKNNELDGEEGYRKESDGTILKGRFKKNSLNGNGVIMYAFGDTLIGYFNNNRLHSNNGKRLNKDGSRYEGDFLEGKYEGNGKYYWNDGVVFSGVFVDGRRNGPGTLGMTEIWKITGNWKMDQLDGTVKFEVYSPQGEVMESAIEFENGNLVKGKNDYIDNVKSIVSRGIPYKF
jgi:hypothetical protein